MDLFDFINDEMPLSAYRVESEFNKRTKFGVTLDVYHVKNNNIFNRACGEYEDFLIDMNSIMNYVKSYGEMIMTSSVYEEKDVQKRLKLRVQMQDAVLAPDGISSIFKRVIYFKFKKAMSEYVTYVCTIENMSEYYDNDDPDDFSFWLKIKAQDHMKYNILKRRIHDGFHI